MLNNVTLSIVFLLSFNFSENTLSCRPRVLHKDRNRYDSYYSKKHDNSISTELQYRLVLKLWRCDESRSTLKFIIQPYTNPKLVCEKFSGRKTQF